MLKQRLDRTLSVDLIAPLASIWKPWRRPHIPILMYHSIRAGTGLPHPYYETRTAPKVFAAHMRYLRDRGYFPCTVEEALVKLAQGTGWKSAVVLTFDDGYRDFCTSALPVLAALGFSATVYVVSDFVQRASSSAHPDSYMTWSDLRTIRSQNITIGSHSKSHPVFRTLSPEHMAMELGESKSTIEQETGSSVESFSFPHSFSDHDRKGMSCTRNLLGECGYRSAVSTAIGTVNGNSDRFLLPRLSMNSYDDLELLDAKLQGNYDWMHIAQRMRKRFAGMGQGEEPPSVAVER